jgi:hypothetical protein
MLRSGKAVGLIGTLLGLACGGSDSNGGEPLDAEECAKHSECGVDAPCAEGSCLSIQNCATLICIDQTEACRLLCGSKTCEILESFPAQVRCARGSWGSLSR